MCWLPADPARGSISVGSGTAASGKGGSMSVAVGTGNTGAGGDIVVTPEWDVTSS